MADRPLELKAPRLTEIFRLDRWIGSRGFLLPIAARGLYREMLSQAWRRGGWLPANHEAIRRACGVSDEEWAEAWPLVRKFWRRNGSRITNETQTIIFRIAKDRAESFARRAIHGSAQRWNKNGDHDASSIAQASSQALLKDMLKQCDPQSPILNPHIKKKIPPVVPPGGRRRKTKTGPTCPHDPRCRSFTACRDRTLADGRQAKAKP